MLAREILAVAASAAAEGPVISRSPRSTTPTATSGSRREPARPGRARGGHGPAGERAGTRPQPRLHQARGPRDPGPCPVPQQLGPPPLHRHPHDQRLPPSLRDHLRAAPRIPPATRRHRVHARVVLPRRRPGFEAQYRPRHASTTATSAATRRNGPTYPAEARYGTNYVGLRNRLSVLSEAYAYDPYKDRVLATRDFVASASQTAASTRTRSSSFSARPRARR